MTDPIYTLLVSIVFLLSMLFFYKVTIGVLIDLLETYYKTKKR